MDFTIFDNKEHIPALSWLGRKDWIHYQNFSETRTVSAKPRPLLINPTPAQIEKNKEKDPIIVQRKEFEQESQDDIWPNVKKITSVLEHDVIGTFWYYTLSKALAGGPKLFKPTLEQCEALQHAEARYGFEDYKQPFPVIILEIPLEYQNKLKEQYKINESPSFVLVHYENDKFINVSAFYNQNNIITHVTPKREEYPTIEDSLIKNRIQRNDVLNEYDSQFDAAENVQRLGINFAMMMSLFSVKEKGPLDPSAYRRWELEAKGKVHNKPTNRAMAARKNIAAAMFLLQFNQNVDFYDEIEENIEVAQGVDIDQLRRSPRTHWRRGHFRSQAYGVGLKERKIVFIKPVFVRSQYFIGQLKDAAVTYTAHPGRQIHE